MNYLGKELRFQKGSTEVTKKVPLVVIQAIKTIYKATIHNSDVAESDTVLWVMLAALHADCWQLLSFLLHPIFK